MSLPTLTLRIAFATNPLEASPTWSDRSDDFISGEVIRGRDRELQRPDAGVFNLELDNNHRAYEPLYTAGPFYPNVLPLRKVQLLLVHQAVTYYVYTGFIERWPQNWEDANLATVKLTAVDAFEFLARYDLNGSYPQELSGARINRVLDEIGWPAADRMIDAGQSTVAAATFAATDEKKALDHMQDVADTELGYLFVDGQGRVVFHDRHRRLKTPYTVSQGIFGDAGAEVPYDVIVPSYDKDEIANEYRVTRAGGTTQTASDATSQAKYGKRVRTRSPLLTSDSEAADMAGFLVARYRDPALRFEGLSLRPLADDTIWPQVLGRELGDRITCRRRPPEHPTGTGQLLEQDCHIERIHHVFDLDRNWATYFDVSPAAQQSYWTLGDATSSLLGSTTVLAY